MLLLAEQLFLLSIDPKTMRPYGRAASALSYSLNGALLAELALDGYIKLCNSKIEVVNTNTVDPLLQEILGIIKTKPLKTPKQLISILRTSHKSIQYKIASKLNDDGIIILEKKQLLGTVPVYFYKLNSNHFVKEIQEKFQIIIDKNKKQTSLVKEERIVVLMSLVHASSLLRIGFTDRKEAREAEKQIKELNKYLPIPEATKRIIDSINVSVFAAAAYFSGS